MFFFLILRSTSSRGQRAIKLVVVVVVIELMQLNEKSSSPFTYLDLMQAVNTTARVYIQLCSIQ